jgi:hypothetical protein
MRRKTFYVRMVLSAVVLQSCTSEPDYKEVRQEVIEIHDKLMAEDGQVTANRMKLDTLSQAGPAAFQAGVRDANTAQVRKELAGLRSRLKSAEDEMSDWMHQFNPEVSGKSNAEAVAYFRAEKQKVLRLDSLYKNVIRESSNFLKRTGYQQGPQADAGHNHPH